MSKYYKVAVYARLSSADRNQTESESILNQIELAKDYCNKHGLRIKKIYTDDGFTGSNFERPSFQLLIDDIKNKNINMVITKDVSRLGRNLLGAGYYIEEFFPENNVRYISITDNYDSLNSTGEEMLQIRNFINELYVKECRKKIRQSVIRRSTTKIMSTGFYGYNRVQNGLEINQEQAAIVKEIFLRFIEGESVQKIADDLKSREVICPEFVRLGEKSKRGKFGWCYNAVYEILKKQDYVGDYSNWKKKDKKDHKEVVVISKGIPAIIPKELYETAQKIFDSRNHHTVLSDEVRLKGYYFTNDKVMIYSSKPGEGRYYARGCSISAKAIHAATYNYCLDVINKAKSMDKDFIKETEESFNLNNYVTEKEALEREYRIIENEYKKLFEKYFEGGMDQTEYELSLDMCKSKLELNEEKQNEIISKIYQIQERIKSFYKYLNNISNIESSLNPLELIRTISSRCDVEKILSGEFKLHVHLKY